MFAKVDVNGFNAHPVWSYMKAQKGELLGNDIKWNFAKFLVHPHVEKQGCGLAGQRGPSG